MRGLAFETAGWLGETFTLDVGGDVETYAFAEDALSAVAALELLVAWANAAGRAWSGAAVFVWDSLAHVDSKIHIQITCSISVDAWSYTSELETKLGLPTGGDTTSATLTSTAGALATVDADFAVLDYWRQDATQGVVSGSGAMRFHSQATSARRPSVRSVMTGPQLVATRVAEFAASVPRRMDVYQRTSVSEGTGGWRRLAVGLVEVGTVAEGLSIYAVTFEAIG